MLTTTPDRLRCPACEGKLRLIAPLADPSDTQEIPTGTLACTKCKSRFPILAGVAVLVADVREYLQTHAKGISKVVDDSEIPKAFLDDYLEAKGELLEQGAEHIEEDLEADRVIALYLMNHYLRTATPGADWWLPQAGPKSPLIDGLIREHWDHGPLAQIEKWLKERPAGDTIVELGRGIAGLSRAIAGHAKSYLGIDSSFASIALGRHLALGVPYPGKTRIPGDLLVSPLSREVSIPKAPPLDGTVDLVVGELDRVPAAQESFDVSIVLNAIDMMPEPELLPKIQKRLLKPGGLAVQSCPYIWHEQVARELRARLPKGVKDSASAVEWLYERAGLRIERRIEHLPWLFFKHLRQLEIYSVHLFEARKS